MKKKVITLILSLALVTSLAGCGSKKNDTFDKDVNTTVTTEDTKTEDLAVVNEERIEDFSSQGISLNYDSSKWIKVTADGYELCLLDENRNLLNLVIESMQGLSEEVYNMASDKDVRENLGIENINVKEENFNDNKARVTYYVQKYNETDIPTLQVTFLKDGKSYIFTIMCQDEIKSEVMERLTTILNTVTFN